MVSVHRMPWGKYRGQSLDELPASYLLWCLESADALQPDLRRAIRAELGSRFNPLPPPPSFRSCKPCPDPAQARALIDAGLHSLARKHHPDIGGDTSTMQTINCVADWLKGIV